MLFTSFIFLQIFLPAIALIHALLKNVRCRNLFLLSASLLFYAWGEPENIFLLIFSIAVNYFTARYGLAFSLPEKVRKLMLALGIIFNLLILAIFKYTSTFLFFLDEFFHFSFKISSIALPLGISFFTFQILSYLIDTFRRENEPQKNIFDLGLFIMLFPQLVAGPIVKYHDISKELTSRNITLPDYASGIRRFVYGLGKKVLIANQMALIADEIFLIPDNILDCKIAWLGIITYSLQIYFDFSGYSDMAIGLGRMFGFHFKENFNLPYAATSIQDFWRRWHISLSSWFKEYLYIPLGGSRQGEKITCRNIMIVFIITGIWHGAGLNFIIWGAYYGILLVLERWKLKTLMEKSPAKIFNRLYTLLAVMIGWVFFRADDLPSALQYIGKLFSFTDNKNLPSTDFITPSALFLILAAILLCAPVPLIKYFRHESSRQNIRWYDLPLQLILLAASLLMLAGNTYNPFIYFRF